MDINDLKGGDNIITLDDITGKFNTRTQRQDYYEPKEEAEKPGANIYDPFNETTASDYGAYGEEEEVKTVTPEQAQRTGRRIAQAIDVGFNYVASNFIAKNSEKDYKANPGDLEDIAQAWGEIAEEKHWKVSPYMQLMVLYLIVYAPLAKQAFTDRKVMEIENKTNSHEDQIKALQNELARLKEKQGDKA